MKTIHTLMINLLDKAIINKVSREILLTCVISIYVADTYKLLMGIHINAMIIIISILPLIYANYYITKHSYYSDDEA